MNWWLIGRLIETKNKQKEDSLYNNFFCIWSCLVSKRTCLELTCKNLQWWMLRQKINHDVIDDMTQEEAPVQMKQIPK